MTINPAQRLLKAGQSVWYDNISREIIENGELHRLLTEWGVRGITSNPSIFDAALKDGNDYDAQVASLKGQSLSVSQVFEEIALHDIAAAADILKPVYEQSNGDDGFCSIEVSPLLATNTEATIEEAKRLHNRLERPNIMVKIPGTPEGLPAIKRCLEAGISINITLLFSVENYRDVANIYCEAMQNRLDRGESVSEIRSVASFFVSRVDTIIDSKLEELAEAEPQKRDELLNLRGKFGIANSKLAYKVFQEIFESDSFSALKAAGVAVQRPLWASTGVKNPDYRDVQYVEELIGPMTVNTMPHKTLEAFVDHGEVKENAVTTAVADAEALQQQLLAHGVAIDECLDQLQTEGVKKFVDSFHALHATLEEQL